MSELAFLIGLEIVIDRPVLRIESRFDCFDIGTVINISLCFGPDSDSGKSYLCSVLIKDNICLLLLVQCVILRLGMHHYEF